MLSVIETINTTVNNFIWVIPAMIYIIGVGILSQHPSQDFFRSGNSLTL